VEAARSFKRAAELGDVVGQFFSCLDVVIWEVMKLELIKIEDWDCWDRFLNRERWFGKVAEVLNSQSWGTRLELDSIWESETERQWNVVRWQSDSLADRYESLNVWKHNWKGDMIETEFWDWLRWAGGWLMVLRGFKEQTND
jgi:hypothetical protein